MTEYPASDTIYESVNSVRSPLILDMLAYWQSKRAAERLPRPADIDPTEIPKLIASIVICDRNRIHSACAIAWPARARSTSWATN